MPRLFRVNRFNLMRPLRAFLCLSAALAAVCAQAMPDFWEVFQTHYQPRVDSEIAKAACVTCHTSKDKTTRNPFGLQLEELMDANRKKELTVLMLQQVENLDANQNGITNGEEIRVGSLPGAPAAGAAPPKAAEAPELIPDHSFHPAVVHFPIALFLFGGALDFWGWRKRKPEARYGAAIALWIGALTSLLAIPTGVAAWLRIGFPLEGTMLIHLLLGVTSSVCMIALAQWRRKSDRESLAYWLALAFVAILVAAAGHFGSVMVFG